MKAKTGIDPAQTTRWREATRAVRAGTRRSELGEASEALFLTSGFAYDTLAEAERRFADPATGYTYSRQANPTVEMFEERLRLLEDAAFARATATGMAAIAACLFALLRAGERVLAHRVLFGSSRWLLGEWLPRYGIAGDIVDATDLDAVKAALTPRTRLMLIESPTNPTLEILDIAALADICRANGTLLVVDNVFATPILQKPLALGADLVVYSATKHIDGQGRVLGGAILGQDEALLEEPLGPFLRHTGPTLSAFDAWVLLKGLETLPLRVRAMSERAETIAHFLSARGLDVRYPGLPGTPGAELARRQMAMGGTLVAFRLPSGGEQVSRFFDALTIIDIGNNLGDVKSIAAHPWTTTHRALPEETRRELGIDEGLVRLSVGLEDPDDLIADLDHALAAAGL
ncbi:MAG: aminotransferase class I/II-fold pyridoxal phosphate-dependent enzyme [Alphaproteobacteria bacterium]|nr:MAG: aminotransferase class I/II-fold pyridoxal phosphate-dependent enzyme [Alphaproteobacteria bacterium]